MDAGSSSSSSSVSVASTGTAHHLASPFFHYRPIDEPDDLDVCWSKAFPSTLKWLEGNDFQALSIEQLTQHTLGLLYGILTQPTNAERFFHVLVTVSKDELLYCISQLEVLICAKFYKLRMGPALQIVWLIDRFLSKGVTKGIDLLVIGLFRWIPPGDTRETSLRVSNELLPMLLRHLPWLYAPANAHTLGVAAYSALTLLGTHRRKNTMGNLAVTISFVQTVLRQQWRCCAMTIGRDFVRAVHAGAVLDKIPELQEFWNLLRVPPAPGSSSSSLGATVGDILAVPTNRLYLRSRLAPDFENKLLFLCHRVPLKQFRRYSGWLHSRYLNANPDQLLLVPEMLRYLCGVFHPTNEMLANPNAIPRWQMLGWWLKAVEGNKELRWMCEQAVLFDWYCYGLYQPPGADVLAPHESLMNLEPAMLVMYQSLPKHPEITVPLLRQLFNAMEVGVLRINYNPTEATAGRPMTSAQVTDCTGRAMATMVSKGVVRDLSRIYDSPKLDPAMREKFHRAFAKQIELCVRMYGPQERTPPAALAPAKPPSVVIPALPSSDSDAGSDAGDSPEAQRRRRSMERCFSPSLIETDSSDISPTAADAPVSIPVAFEPHATHLAAAIGQVRIRAEALPTPLPPPQPPTAEDLAIQSQVHKSMGSVLDLLTDFSGSALNAHCEVLAVWLLSELAPELAHAISLPVSSTASRNEHSGIGLSHWILGHFLSPLSATFTILNTLYSRLNEASTKSDSEPLMHKLYQLLLALVALDPSFAVRWLIVCGLRSASDGLWLIDSHYPNVTLAVDTLSSLCTTITGSDSGNGNADSGLGASPGEPPSATQGLLLYWQFCLARSEAAATSKGDPHVIVVNDIRTCADLSKPLLLILLPIVLRHLLNSKIVAPPTDALMQMLLGEERLHSADDFVLQTILNTGGVRLVQDVDGSLVNLFRSSLRWSSTAQQLLWRIVAAQFAACVSKKAKPSSGKPNPEWESSTPMSPQENAAPNAAGLFVPKPELADRTLFSFMTDVLKMLRKESPSSNVFQVLAGLLSLDLWNVLKTASRTASNHMHVAPNESPLYPLARLIWEVPSSGPYVPFVVSFITTIARASRVSDAIMLQTWRDLVSEISSSDAWAEKSMALDSASISRLQSLLAHASHIRAAYGMRQQDRGAVFVRRLLGRSHDKPGEQSPTETQLLGFSSRSPLLQPTIDQLLAPLANDVMAAAAAVTRPFSSQRTPSRPASPPEKVESPIPATQPSKKRPRTVTKGTRKVRLGDEGGGHSSSSGQDEDNLKDEDEDDNTLFVKPSILMSVTTTIATSAAPVTSPDATQASSSRRPRKRAKVDPGNFLEG